jgi:thiamine pyrophosphate-dependent acetolactate synthase large subunit-like protein
VKSHQALAQSLHHLGVDTIFGVMGDANLFMVDSFVRECGGTFVPATHEANSVIMAKSYAELTGHLGVATVTHGPGLTNTATALVECVRAGAPVLLVAGDTALGDIGNIQRMGQEQFVRSLGAGFESVPSGDRTYECVLRAARRALVESRPVVLNVPAGFAWDETTVSGSGQPAIEHREPLPNPGDLDEALGIVMSAARPLVLAGFGARHDEARDSLVALAETLGAPLATTLKAKDLFFDNPQSIGIFGTLATEVGSKYIAASDCILAFGVSMSRWTTAGGELLAGKRLVQVDWDPAALGQRAPISAGVAGGAAVTAATMLEWVSGAGVKPSGFGALVAREGGAEPTGGRLSANGAEALSVGKVAATIASALGAERVLVADLGRAIFDAVVSVPTPRPGAFVWTANFGSIGLGMSGAIGAHYARPGSPIILVTGDGGYMMGGLAELSTAVRAKMDLVVVLANDGSYGAEHVQFRDRGMDPSLTLSAWPDLAAVARSMGADAITLHDVSDLPAAYTAVAERSRTSPLLLDVRLDPETVPRAGH